MKLNSMLHKGLAVVVLVTVILLAACSQPAKPEAPADSGSTAETMVIEGKVLLEEQCTRCHDLERTTSKNKDEAGWMQTVERMVQKGASLTAEEQAVLIQYLVDNYGPVTQ